MKTFKEHWQPLIEKATNEDEFIALAMQDLGDGDAGKGRKMAPPGFYQSMQRAMNEIDTDHWEDRLPLPDEHIEIDGDYIEEDVRRSELLGREI